MYYKNHEGELVEEKEDQVVDSQEEVLVREPKPKKRNSPRKIENFRIHTPARRC